MITIYTDGSSRRNGKPDCVAGYAAYIEHADTERVLFGYETASTSQRGELHAMCAALIYVAKNTTPDDSVTIVSDSAYIVDCLRGEWYRRWNLNGWKTATGNEVKNQDLWLLILNTVAKIPFFEDRIDVWLIKGHTNNLQVAKDKFKKNNYDIELGDELMNKFVQGNDKADVYAKRGRDDGEKYCVDPAIRDFVALNQ